MRWPWILPLAATLLASAALARSLALVAREVRLLRASADRLAPVAASFHDSVAKARAFSATVADAAHRYTPRDGQRRRR